MPSSRGKPISITIISGLSFSAAATPKYPSSACPTISISGESAKTCSNPSCIIGSSSTIKILIIRRKKEEGRRKKEEGRRKKEEGRRKKEDYLVVNILHELIPSQ